MFAFNPGVNDMSGQILGQAAVGAANTTAQANVQFADQMGDSLMGLAGSLASGYMKKKEMESAVKSGDQMLNMFGDQLGITEDKLKQFNYGEMGLDDKYAFHQNLWGNLGALSNIRIANRNAGIRENQPFVAADLQNRRNIAGGKTTYGNPSGLSSVEPDLPVGDDFLPPVRHGAGMQNNITRFAPSQQSIGAARNWGAGYFGKLNF